MTIDSNYYLLYEAEDSQMTLSGRVPFTRENTAVLFIDHQVGLFTGVGGRAWRRPLSRRSTTMHTRRPTCRSAPATIRAPSSTRTARCGTSGLHIVGTSIMPDIDSVATNLATIMIAEAI